jgi:hypothetical protein
MARNKPDRRGAAAALAAFAIAIATAIAGCSSSVVSSANPFHARQPPVMAAALRAGVLPDPARMSPNPRYPFQESWVRPGVDFQNYREVMLAPVSLEHLEPPPPDSSGNVSQDYKTAALDAAIFAGDAFGRAVQDDPAHRFTLASRPDAKTIVVEMAIVGLNPTRPDSTASSFGIPTFASASSALMRESNLKERGSIGIEMALRDGRSNQVIAIFADTRRAPVPQGDQKITPGFGFVDQIVGDWMRQIVAMLKS